MDPPNQRPIHSFAPELLGLSDVSKSAPQSQRRLHRYICEMQMEEIINSLWSLDTAQQAGHGATHFNNRRKQTAEQRLIKERLLLLH